MSDGITFADILSPPAQIGAISLQSALFITYICDWEWFLPLIANVPGHIHMVLNWLPETSDSEQPLGTPFAQGTRQNLTHKCCQTRPMDVTHPALTDNSLMHIKMFCLDFGSWIRIVVGSANLTLDDWEGLSQALWVQEFPKVGENGRGSVCDFSQSFRCILTELGLEGDRVDAWVNCADYSTANAALVFSTPTLHGTARVKEILSKCFPEIRNKCQGEVVYQASAIGGLDIRTLAALEDAFGGYPIVPVFPSQETCEMMMDFTMGMITVRYFQQEGVTMLSQRVRDTGVTPATLHSKVAYHLCRGKDSCCGQSWCYIGSHNLTKDAWGGNKNFEGGVIVVDPGVVLPFVRPSMRFPSYEVASALPLCPSPFKFYPSKRLLLDRGRQLQAMEGWNLQSPLERARHYHWWMFLVEYRDNYGRH